MKKIKKLVLFAGALLIMLSGCGNHTVSENDVSDLVTRPPVSGRTEPTASNITKDGKKIPGNTVTGNEDANDAFVIWGWNSDIKNILDNVFAYDYPELYNRIVFVNTNGNDFYQGKIDEILKNTDDKLYPDLIGLEADYVLKYVNSDNLKTIQELGIDKSECSKQYAYNLDLCTSHEGDIKALFWQATPGSIQIRADYAKKYLGTTDQAELQSIFTDWNTILDTARKVYKASDGKCRLFAGYDELKYIFLNSRNVGWYDKNNTLTIDPCIDTYMNLCKTLQDENLTYGAVQWTPEWSNLRSSNEEQQVLSFVGCPWFTYWSLSEDWIGNTILVRAPKDFYYGGTGLAATSGCSDTELAKIIIRYITCDTSSMVKIADYNKDFVNNVDAIKELKAKGVTNPYMYGGQNYLDFYLQMVNSISATSATGEDRVIHKLLYSEIKDYAEGKCDMQTAYSEFKDSVCNEFKYLKQ